MAKADLARFIDPWTMEYVRVYPHPIERVWRAITDPAEFGVWWIKGGLDPRVGGAYWYGSPDGDFKGLIVAIEPPRLIRFADPPAGRDGYFEYRLAPTDSGTRMTFVQHGTPGFVADGWPWPGMLSGWHLGFDDLADFLDGVEFASRLPPDDLSDLLDEWASRPPPSAQEFTREQRRGVVSSLRRRARDRALREAYAAHKAATRPAAEEGAA
jgi:uncharacterized protein YndB with AHSA1/START domain